MVSFPPWLKNGCGASLWSHTSLKDVPNGTGCLKTAPPQAISAWVLPQPFLSHGSWIRWFILYKGTDYPNGVIYNHVSLSWLQYKASRAHAILFLKFCFVSPWLHLYYSYFFVNMVNRFPFKDHSPPFQAWAWFIFNQMMGEVGTRIKGVRLCKFCNLV